MNSEPLKALHIVGQLEFGGITTWLKTLVETAPSNELDIDICCDYRKGIGILAEDFIRLGCKVYHVPLDYNLFNYQKKLKQIIKKNQYQVIHSHRSFLSGPSLKAAASMEVPVRIAFHHSCVSDLAHGFFRDRYYSLTKRWELKYATHIWGSSEAVLMENYGLEWESKDKRLNYLYGPVKFSPPENNSRERIRQEEGIDLSDRVIGIVGRVTQIKNPIVALKVCLEILKKYSDVQILWVGDGDLLPCLKEIAEKSGFVHKIHFLGFRRDVVNILEAVDIFFQPSKSEGFGLSILEALHVGLPVVASNASGILEALPKTMQHFCSKPDDVDAHVSNIRKLLDNPVNRYIPREFLVNFSPNNFYQRLISSYKQAFEGAA